MELLVEYWSEDAGIRALIRDRVVTAPQEGTRYTALELLARYWPSDPLTPSALREIVATDPSEDVRSATAQAVEAVEAILAGGEFP